MGDAQVRHRFRFVWLRGQKPDVLIPHLAGRLFQSSLGRYRMNQPLHDFADFHCQPP